MKKQNLCQFSRLMSNSFVKYSQNISLIRTFGEGLALHKYLFICPLN